MKAKKILAAVTALSLTTVVFASCGDSADSSSSTAAVVICTLIVTLAGSYFKCIASCVKSYDSVAVCIRLRYLFPLAVFQHKDTIV